MLWAALIFTASGDQQSSQRSSRLIAPLVRWLFPQLPDETVHAVVTVVRKAAHVSEYAVMAWLFWRVFHRPEKNDPRPWQWREALLAWLCAALFAITDEVHQAFVPSRQGSVWDVLIDAAGAAAGLLILWSLGRWRRRW